MAARAGWVRGVSGLAFWLGLILAGLTGACAQEVVLEDCRRIWDQAPHCAFTDLVRHRREWICVFREGSGHVSPDGAIRVLASRSGDEWHSVARLVDRRGDLRDPKIVEAPDRRLMLTAAVARPSSPTHQTLVWFSKDGREWSEPSEIGDPGVWLWRVTWNERDAYGVGYGTGQDHFVRLYRSVRGGDFESWVPRLSVDGYPNESSMVFEPDGRAVCLLRRDGTGAAASGWLGVSRPPYKDWEWRDLGMRLGGPHLLALPDGRMIAAVRVHTADGPRTTLAWLDPDAGTLRECLTLPSGGDTSYAGLGWRRGRLWVSYYSSHEGRTAIYLARVRVPRL